jgi:hypothetical protein
VAEEGWWEMGGAHRGMVLAAVQWNFERQSQDRRKNDGAQPDDVRVAPRRERRVARFHPYPLYGK